MHFWCPKCVFDVFRGSGLGGWNSLMHMRGREFQRFFAFGTQLALPTAPEHILHRALARDRSAKPEKLVPNPCGISAPHRAHARKRCPAVANRLVASSKRSRCSPGCAAGQSLAVRGKGMAGRQRWIILMQFRARAQVLTCVAYAFLVSQVRF